MGYEGQKSIRTPQLPLHPVWEKGAGGMRGKNTREGSAVQEAWHVATRSGIVGAVSNIKEACYDCNRISDPCERWDH